LDSVVVKSIDERAVRLAMDDYAARLLAARPDIEEIVVFGSFERGTWAPGSDLDVFIVLASADRPVHERVVELLPGAFPVGIDLLPFTRDEIARRTPSALFDTVAASRWRYRRDPGGPGSGPGPGISGVGAAADL
jgi:predicted nucleotidyltransferase